MNFHFCRGKVLLGSGKELHNISDEEWLGLLLSPRDPRIAVFNAMAKQNRPISACGKVKAMPACELCHREMGEITPHYLIPRTRHKHKKSKKDVTRDGVKGRPVALCRPCHKRVHMLPNKEVEQYF